MSGSPRIGVLGGSFDPIHIAHLLVAQEARAQLGLEKVLLVPARDQWRKAGRTLAETDHRLRMVELAVQDDPCLGVSTVDLDRSGPSYTVDTLTDIGRTLEPGQELVFILGYDAINDLPYWKEAGRLAELTGLAAVVRPGYSIDWPALERVVPNARDSIAVIPMPEVGISSTEIRRRIAAGLPIRHWVPDAVQEYICQHQLYR